MPIVVIALVSFVAWLLSTLAGGGSPFVLIPLVNFLLGPAAVPPVITLGMLLGNGQRVFLFWRDIDWKLTLWYLPGGIAGGILGAYTFAQIHLEWLELLFAVFLLASAASFAFGQKERTFRVRAWYLLPAGFGKAFVSGLVGSSGPVLVPFYLNYGLVKEQIIGTKALHMFVLHLVKIVSYAAFGLLTPQHLSYGLAIGLAAFPANLIGRYLLKQIKPQQFRQLVLVAMTISGILILWSERDLVAGFWSFWQPFAA